MNDHHHERETELDYDGPLEELRDILHGRELVVAFETFGVEWYGQGALLRGRMPNKQPIAVFVPIITLCSLLA